MHSIFIIIIIICFHDYSYQLTTEIPSIVNKQALQWLNIPHRWNQQYSSNEINQSLKRLEILNENGIQQFDSQSIDSVSLEVLYELYRQGKRTNWS